MTNRDIILIVADNQQAETLGCYGNAEAYTPNLDALADSGWRFDNAFCPNAMCSPCRASIMTGMLPSAHGLHSWIDDRRAHEWPENWHALSNFDTLPEHLQRQGYVTGLFGKYHLGTPETVAPGWDRWVTMEHGHIRSFYENDIIDGDTKALSRYRHVGHTVEFFADKAIKFLAEQEEPAFAYIPFPAPYGHWPSTSDGARNRFAERFDDCPMKSIPREGLSADAIAHYDQIKAVSGDGLDFSMLLRAPNDLETLRNYYSQIALIDDAVGRIARENPEAVIIYTADHGLSLGHHGFWGHGSATWPSNLHRAAHSVPLIVHGAGIGVSKRMVSNIDLFATILDLVKAPMQSDLPSRVIWDLAGPDEIYSEQEETRVLRTTRWAYFQRFRKDGLPPLPDALYDTQADPRETCNVINNPAYASVAAELSTRLTAFFAQHSRPEFDLWRGGRPVQNSLVPHLWKDAWGPDWAPTL